MSAPIEIQLLRNGTMIGTAALMQRPLVVGRALSSDLVISTDALHRALLWSEGGEVWIRDLDSEAGVYLAGRRLQDAAAISGKPVRLGGDIELRIRHADADCYPYRAAVSLNGAVGPEARIADLQTGQECVVHAEVRVNLFYLLARQLRRDTERRLPPDERGWCSNDQIATGVWGRVGARDRSRGQLHVLVHRARKDLLNAGLDGQCIEKRRGYARMFVEEALVS